MDKNTNTDKALAEGKTDNKRSLAIFGGAALVALALAAGPLIAHSVSAANLSNGVMMVRTVDKDGFEGFAGRSGDGSNPGTENPGGTDPGTNPGGGTDPGTNPGGGTDPGTNPGGGTGPGNGGTDPESPSVPVLPQAAITITGCTTTNQAPLNIFRSVTLSWTTSREIKAPGMIFEVRGGATQARVPSSFVKETGRTESGVVSYTATLTQADLSSLATNLLGATTALVVREEADPRIHPSDPKWVAPAFSKTRELTVPLSGVGAICR